MLLIIIAVQAEHAHWTDGFTDHAPHCPRAVGFERTAPAQNDEITVVLSREIDDGGAGLALSERETNVDPIRCTPDSPEPVEELLRPCRPLVLGLVDVARVPGSVGSSGPAVATCSTTSWAAAIDASWVAGPIVAALVGVPSCGSSSWFRAQSLWPRVGGTRTTGHRAARRTASATLPNTRGLASVRVCGHMTIRVACRSEAAWTILTAAAPER